MTLQKKIFVIVFPLLIFLFGLVYWYLSQDLLGKIGNAQKIEAMEQASLVSNLFENERDNLARKAADWSQWDDTYEFVETRDPKYIESNLNDESFTAIGVNVIVIRNRSGETIVGKEVSSGTSTEDLSAYADALDRLTKKTLEKNEKQTGFLLLRNEVFLVTAQPILHSDGSGDSRGVLFFGRYLDRDLKSRIEKASLAHVDFIVTPDPFSLEGIEEDRIGRLLRGERPELAILFGKEKVVGYDVVEDIFAENRMVIRVRTIPTIYLNGHQDISLFGSLMLFFGIVFFTILFLVLEFFVLHRLRVLTRELDRVDNPDAKISLSGADEFAHVAGVINRMLERIRSATAMISSEKARAEGILKYLQSIGEAVFATDKSGNVVFCNAKAMLLSGLDEKNILLEPGDAIFRFFRGKGEKRDDLAPVSSVIDRNESGIFPQKTFFEQRDGTLLPVSGTYSPILEQGHIAGAVVVFQDMTDRYELEKAKDNFLSVAAHQLRTPLGSMRWNMELLQGGDFGKVSDEVHTAVEDLYRNSGRMLSLVNDLLEVSRIDRGKNEEESSDIDLKKVVAEIVKTLEGEAEKRNIRMEVHIPEHAIPVFRASKKRVFESLENLVSNAIRYNREGGSVDVFLDADSGKTTLKIRDTGIGIPEKDREKLFKKFYRASNAAESDIDGTGLGLYISKAYIEEVGGAISFESRVNEGTTFTVEFPARQS